MKEYLPSYKTIPAIMILGGIGAVIVLKAVPAFTNWLAAKVPVVAAPKA